MADLKKAAQSVARATKGAVETTRGAVETAKAVASKMAERKAERDEAALRRRFQKGVKRPGNAAPNTEPCKEGMRAWKWPKLTGEWLEAFPDFPYHIKGLRCVMVGEGRVNETVYLSPKDRDLLQGLVNTANDRLIDAEHRWGFPVFRHAVPTLHGSPRDVVKWPPDYAMLTAYPFTALRGDIQDLPFTVSMVVPYWRPDGCFDEVRLKCQLDASGHPQMMESEYRPYREGIGFDFVKFISHLTDDGWRYFRVETEFNNRFKGWVAPYQESPW